MQGECQKLARKETKDTLHIERLKAEAKLKEAYAKIQESQARIEEAKNSQASQAAMFKLIVAKVQKE